MGYIQEWKEDGFLLKLISGKFVQAGISAIPYVGGPAQVVISGYIQEIRDRRWKSYWESVEQRVRELGQEKVDADYFATEDFVSRFRTLHNEVVERADTEKFNYLRDYFIGCIWKIGPDVVWKDLFFQYLTRCSGAHLGVLESFYSIQSQLSLTDRFNLPKKTEKSPLTVNEMQKLNPTFDVQLIEILINDLEAFGLIKAWLGSPVEPRGWSISDAGLLFMRFLRIEWGS
jgi:hypothetical protein